MTRIPGQRRLPVEVMRQAAIHKRDRIAQALPFEFSMRPGIGDQPLVGRSDSIKQGYF